jgi:hypothetical protein
MHTDILNASPVSHWIAGGRGVVAVTLAIAVLGCAPALNAQSPAIADAGVPTHRAGHPRKHLTAAPAQPTAAQAASAPVPPPAPVMPLWPANEKPAQATVVWDSQGLRIDAVNSSLQQILNDVATATGTKVEGFDSDARVFGAYGPGPARDVLSDLLQGSGYNVIMIGDQGRGTPREIVLSARRVGDAQPAANAAQPAQSDEDADVEEQPQPQTPPMRPGFQPGGPPRSPQQIMQEMQQRQQQMQQQQQRNVPQN